MKFREIKDQESAIEIIAFNYDGQGSALYHDVGDSIIKSMQLKDLLDQMIGPEGGSPTYEILDSD